MNPPPRSGFSLIEALVVLGLLGLLVSLILPAVQRVRTTAERASCANRLQQIALALHHYHARHGRLPPGPASHGPSDPNLLLSWTALLLPDLDQESCYRLSVRACQEDANPLHNPPHAGLATVIPVVTCPADSRLRAPLTDRFAMTASYASYVGVGGALWPNSRTGRPGVLGDSPGIALTEIADGTSQTVMIGERPPPESLQAGWWYPGIWGSGIGFRGPNNVLVVGMGLQFANDQECGGDMGTYGPGRLDNPCDRFHFWSLHPGGAAWAFADGSVRFLTYASSPLIYSLATRAGGERVEIP